MDKYEERVSKILEKKEVYDKAKKQKKKILIQSTGIVMSLVVFISVLLILPRHTGIEIKPENTTAFLSSESVNTETTLVYPESTTEVNSHSTQTSTVATEQPSKAESTTRFQSTVPSTRVHITPGFEEEYPADTGSDYVPPPLSDGDSGGDSGDYIDPYTTKYRRIYYNYGSGGLDVYFANLVSDEEYDEWMKQYYAKQPPNDGIFEAGEKIVEPTRMKIVDFVMYFDIPRDVFEEANNTRCHEMIKWGDVPVMNPKDYKEQEEFEVYNVDIIYTFDDKIINAYYERGEYPFDTEEEYLEAIENDGYITQTEEFIMLEGFEKVTLPALPPNAKPTYIDFDWRSKRCR